MCTYMCDMTHINYFMPLIPGANLNIKAHSLFHTGGTQKQKPIITVSPHRFSFGKRKKKSYYKLMIT